MTEAASVLCYHKGCGMKFNPTDNKEGSCRHHPGVPVFHDALKGWSCCKKRYRDFTDFLNIPGCTEGVHTNVKPAEPEPEKREKAPIDEVVVQTPVNKPVEKPMERPPVDDPMVRLKQTISASLQQTLEKTMKELSLQTDNSTEEDPSQVAVGTSCKNAGCSKEYKDPTTNNSTCLHHPGVPIFHEGMKYWSCCQRKTSDFSSFLSQEGCSSASHLWHKKETAEEKVACRLDWHQTASYVTISIFAKATVPDKTCIEINKVAAKIKIVFEAGKKHFDKDIVLKGVVDPAQSSVKLLGTKVEINLKKAEPGSWSHLELPTS